MALGSQDRKVRQDFKKDIAGKHAWKDAVDSPNAAYTMKKQIETNLAKDPNGAYLLAVYCARQIKLLDDYIANGNGKTLKEYERGKRDER